MQTFLKFFDLLPGLGRRLLLGGELALKLAPHFLQSGQLFFQLGAPGLLFLENGLGLLNQCPRGTQLFTPLRFHTRPLRRFLLQTGFGAFQSRGALPQALEYFRTGRSPIARLAGWVWNLRLMCAFGSAGLGWLYFRLGFARARNFGILGAQLGGRGQPVHGFRMRRLGLDGPFGLGRIGGVIGWSRRGFQRWTANTLDPRLD